MSTETKKKRSIFAIILAVAGVLVNVAMLPSLIRDRSGQYSNYIENVKLFGRNEYSTVFRLSNYHIDSVIILLVLLSIVAYVLAIFFQRIRPIYLLIPAGAIAAFCYFTTVYSNKIYGTSNIVLVFLSLVLFIASLVLLIIGMFTSKARFAFFSMLPTIAAIGAYFIPSDNLLMLIPLANVLGNAAVMFFVLLLYRKPKEKKEKASKIAAVVEAKSETPTTSEVETTVTSTSPITSNSSILTNNTLIIDEKISLATKSFKIYNESGEEIGFIKENVSGGGKAARAFLGKSAATLQSGSLQVCDLNGNVLFGTSKKGLYGSVTDAEGNILCTLKGGNLIDPNGNTLLKFRSTFTKGDFVETLDGNVVANFKKDILTLKAVFTTSDKYTVTITPDTPLDKRILAIGTVLVWEMVVGNH